MAIEQESQAARVTRLCGIAQLKKWTGLTITQIYRWDYPREKGGCGGIIPQKHYQTILTNALASGVPLDRGDFLPSLPAETKPAPGPDAERAA